MNEEELSFSFVNLFLFHRQSPDLRLRATMVFHLVGESARQGRREDVEEAHGVHDVQREPRVFRSEYTVGENGLRGEERWENLVDRHLPRLHRHDVAITDRRRCYALTAMSDRVTRSDTSVSRNANPPPCFARKSTLPTHPSSLENLRSFQFYRPCFHRRAIVSRSRRRDTIERSISRF